MTRSDKLLKSLAPWRRVVVVMHNNPDPDAIASGWGLCKLAERAGKETRLVAGGGITRAENRRLVELLAPPVELVDVLDLDDETAAVLVDCDLRGTNHLLTDNPQPVAAILDHHALPGRPPKGIYVDQRPSVAANASIVASYLQEQELEPGKKLATALLYAIRTETMGGESQHSRLDRHAVIWATQWADPTLLAEIQNAPLHKEYFGDLALALQNTFVYEHVALCLLPQASGAETVGEVADLLIRGEAINRVLCGALVGGDVQLAVRTQEPEDDAAALVHELLKGLGQGGGHEHRAGGKICLKRCKEQVPEAVQDALRVRWLRLCGVKRQRGTRLVPRRDIVANL